MTKVLEYQIEESSLKAKLAEMKEGALPCGESILKGCRHLRRIPQSGEYYPSRCADTAVYVELALPNKINKAELRWNRRIVNSLTESEFLDAFTKAKANFKNTASILGMSRYSILVHWTKQRDLKAEIMAIRISVQTEELARLQGCRGDGGRPL